jgi:cytochrome c553
MSRLAVALCSLFISSFAFSDTLEIGKATYQQQCVACHGKNAEGNQAMKAPNLGGQDDWYVKNQLLAFKQGHRGTSSGDSSGAGMAAISKGLNNKKINGLALYLKTLSTKSDKDTVKGNIEKGEQYYQSLCGSCHGPGGKGNKALNAPKLSGLSDWYLVEQINKFRSGKRGYHSDDKLGRQMKMMAGILPDEQSIKDVASFLAQSSPKEAAGH